MYYQPLDFYDVDSITTTLQEYSKKLLSIDHLYCEVFPKEDVYRLLPTLIKQFEDRGWRFDIAQFFVTPPHSALAIHIDGSQIHKKYWAFNWPVHNCNDSVMHWYDADTDNPGRWGANEDFGEGVKLFNPEQCRLIESYSVTSPTWVKIDVPHTTMNHSDKTRVMSSFRFFND